MPAERRVLVVEDDPLAAKTLIRILTKAGLESRWAGTVKDAVVEVSAWQPDVVLIDRQLPDGDGATLARWLRQLESSPRLVLLSGDPAPASEQATFDAWILKPTSVHALLAALDR